MTEPRISKFSREDGKIPFEVPAETIETLAMIALTSGSSVGDLIARAIDEFTKGPEYEKSAEIGRQIGRNVVAAFDQEALDAMEVQFRDTQAPPEGDV